ncbi:MAG: hypothetical protein AAGN66_28745 [Acidobacteriota bacterium]
MSAPRTDRRGGGARRDGGAFATRLRLQALAKSWLESADVSRRSEDSGLLERAKRHRGLPSDVDPHALAETGWGIVCALEEEQRGVLWQLQELTDFRSDEAKDRYFFQIYDGDPRKPASGFIYETLEEAPGIIDPDKVPYYILIVGSPEQIPFDVQYALSVNHVVGRLYFEDLEDYGRYARAVVSAEREGVRRQRRLGLFAVEQEGDDALEQLSAGLVDPLVEKIPEKTGWNIDERRGERGTAEELRNLMLGDGGAAPGVLIAAAHGVEKDFGSPDQRTRQGALTCPDGAVTADDFQHLDPDTLPLHGLVATLVACFGAGMPVFNEYPHERVFRDEEGAERKAEVLATELETLTTTPFLARLPQKMLSLGTLAILGHVDRGWTHSFLWFHEGRMMEGSRSFVDAQVRLLKGFRIGHAMLPLFQRAAQIGSHLTPMLEAVRNGLPVNMAELGRHWTGYADARGYVLLGDPAVYAMGQPEDLPEDFNQLTDGPPEAQPVYLPAELAAEVRLKAREQGVDVGDYVQKTLKSALKGLGPSFGGGGVRRLHPWPTE